MTDRRPPYVSISLISAGSMSYEVLLTRLFSIIKWHHFAFMIISLALMGYGASGSFLTLARPCLAQRFQRFYVGNIFMFAVSALGCFLIAQTIPFNTQEMLWTPWQMSYLAAIYLLLALPFFFAANAIGLVLIQFKSNLPRLYAADLWGAGIGAVAIVGLLNAFAPQSLLQMLTAGLLATAACTGRRLNLKHRVSWALMFCALGVFLLPSGWLKLKLSPYKGLNQALNVMGTKLIYQEVSAHGLLSVVASPKIPFRHAPGLSLMSSNEIPAQLAVFTDGDNMTVINRYKDDIDRLAYLDHLTCAAPYHTGSIETVLLLNAGGGALALQALYHNAGHITVVESNPHLVALLRKNYAEFCGHLYDHQQIKVYTGEGRGFMSQHSSTYDLIQMELTDSLAASSAGLYALNEGYPYTLEAFEQYIRHLSSNGVLAITRWVKLPPRDNLKLIATAATALKNCGIGPPANHLLVIRGFQTLTMLVKRNGWTAHEIEQLKTFCKARAFDTCYYPGMPESRANQYNLLERPYFFQAAKALLGHARANYMARYKFNLEPATDDRPFFHNFFKWSSLPEILSLLNKGGISLLESGYLVLWSALLQALGFSLILIILPLFWLPKENGDALKRWTAHLQIFSFFFFLGLAFLFIEISFIQKFILFLNRPVYAMAVVISTFLIFAGMGSRFSARWTRNQTQRKGITLAIFTLVLILMVYLGCLAPIFEKMLGWPFFIKLTLSLFIIAPLAFCMGMPFALGLSLLGESFSKLLPWALGINGCASVISAVCTPLLALYLGFTKVIMLALALYLLAAAAINRIK